MRTTGTVKWFDPVTGEGCVVSEGGGYALLARAPLAEYGLKTVAAGATLAYEMNLVDERLTVTAIYQLEAPPRPNENADVDPPPTDPPDEGTRRVKGTVRWFDAAKGFGFIASRDVAADILLHRSVLEEYGVTAILEGADVECDVIAKRRGLQVRRILAMDQTGALRPPPPPPRDVLLQEPTGPALEAECKWFSRPKGFGFLVARDKPDEDIFVHMDLLRKHGIRELRQHQRVLVRVGRSQRGATATEIELLPEPSVTGRSAPEGKPRAPAPRDSTERKTGLVGTLLSVDEERGFGVIAVPELDDVAIADIALLRAAGALDPRTCGRLICDVEFVPPRLVLRCLTRLH